MIVWDAFPYWREQWAVDARLQLWSTLAPEVDYRPVALLGDRTHRGDPLSADRQPPAGGMSVVTVLDADGDWEREKQQRDAVRTVLPMMAPDDLVLLVDADEFVDPRALSAIRAATESGPAKLRMAVYMCGTRWRHPDTWRHPTACRARDLPEHPTDGLRLNFGLPKVPEAGWHLTYYDEDVDAKLRAFAHAEYDNEQTRLELADIREHGTAFVDAPLDGPLADILTDQRAGVTR
jgi:hypothetical protein